MILSHRCLNNRITGRHIVVAVAMTVLITGLAVLIVLLSSARAQRQGATVLIAEPVHLGKNSTVSSPFDVGYETWRVRSNDSFCPQQSFPCNSSRTCVALEKRCDGRVDCHKAEDELNCSCAFRMPSKKFCDKYPDCFDESDESFCSYCPEGYFNCGDGKCIPRQSVCDSRVDCDNFMDENFCFRVSTDVSLNEKNEDPIDSSSVTKITKTGFLFRNKNGAWHPVCANPVDYMQDALASFACVSITANPLAGSTHQYKTFRNTTKSYAGYFIYHHNGRFIKWRQCITNQGIFLSCDDARCGFNPKHLMPKKRRRARIVGGEPSEPGAWPWHGAIYRNGTYACGASLVNHRWLVSAAHCFIDHKQTYYEVQLGMLRRKSFTPHQRTYRIDRVVPHHWFNIVTLDFDIAMLRISEPVSYDFWVRPICLPSPTRVENSGSFCTAIGWGDTGETADDSEDLQEVHVPLTQSCKKDTQRWLCAGYDEGGRDACQGDSGGPLMCLQEDGISWYIAGVISGGRGCARPNTPGMYTRVVYFLDWIQKVVRNPNTAGDRPLETCPGWKCTVVGGGNCLTKDKLCDGHVDCYDAQDEATCLGIKP